jgi:predicted glycosyltransferase involved in capsule biosynthesis
MEKGKISLSDVTFIIPVRIDSLERLDNLQMVTNYILAYCDTNIAVIEAYNRNTGIIEKILHPAIQYLFCEDHLEIFHRTHYINVLVKRVDTPYVAVWDSDVIVPVGQLDMAIKSLRKGESEMILPYNGNFLDTGIPVRNAYFSTMDISVLEKYKDKMRLLFGPSACGGGFLVNKEKYCLGGMENENFFGWGIEDGERIKRFEILDRKVGRVNEGPMYHFTHPRGINSNFKSEEAHKNALKEYLRICSMSKTELQNEIASWYHIKNM